MSSTGRTEVELTAVRRLAAAAAVCVLEPALGRVVGLIDNRDVRVFHSARTCLRLAGELYARCAVAGVGNREVAYLARWCDRVDLVVTEHRQLHPGMLGVEDLARVRAAGRVIGAAGEALLGLCEVESPNRRRPTPAVDALVQLCRLGREAGMLPGGEVLVWILAANRPAGHGEEWFVQRARSAAALAPGSRLGTLVADLVGVEPQGASTRTGAARKTSVPSPSWP